MRRWGRRARGGQGGGAGAARRDGGEHVLVLIIIANAQHKVDRNLCVCAAQYAVGHRALVDAGEAHLNDAFDR